MPKFNADDLVISKIDSYTVRKILAIRHLEHVYLIYFPELKHSEYWFFDMVDKNFRYLNSVEKLLYG